MKKSISVICLFLDIGGVLLSDGWDQHARKRAAKYFKLEFAEMESRHRLVFETFEQGNLTLEEYLSLVVFYVERPFTRVQFRNFIFSQSKPDLQMIDLFRKLKAKFQLKIIVVSNEARELNSFRIHKFKLNAFVDAFISSCYVHLRKPDADIFRLALDVAQVPIEQIVFIDNTALFVRIAEGLGIRSLRHMDFKSTITKLADLGLRNNEGVHGT
jgi:putative hydrolase of the HAD superfamily